MAAGVVVAILVGSRRRRPPTPHPRAKRGDGGGGGSRTRVRKRADERPYRLSPAWCFAASVKAEPNRPRLVRLISLVAYGPKARSGAHIDDAPSDRRGRVAGGAGCLGFS